VEHAFSLGGALSINRFMGHQAPFPLFPPTLVHLPQHSSALWNTGNTYKASPAEPCASVCHFHICTVPEGFFPQRNRNKRFCVCDS